jgi:hypothetical protein
MKHRIKRSLGIGLLILLMGCGQNEKEAQSIHTEEIPSDNSEAVKQSVEQPEEQPDFFTFVDAKGEAYEAEIKEKVPKTVYSDDCFWMENEQTGYEDDAYTSRQGIDVSHHQGGD